MGESLLPSIEVEALEDLRERGDRGVECRTEVRVRRRRTDEAVALSHDIVRVLERMGEFE